MIQKHMHRNYVAQSEYRAFVYENWVLKAITE